MKKYLHIFIIITFLFPVAVEADSSNFTEPSLNTTSKVTETTTDNLNTLQNINLPSINRTLVFSGYTLNLPDVFKHIFDSGFSVFLKNTGSSTYQQTGLTQITSNVPFAPATTTINKAIPNAALIGVGYKLNQNIEVQVIPISIGLSQKDGNTTGNNNTTGTLFGFIYNF